MLTWRACLGACSKPVLSHQALLSPPAICCLTAWFLSTIAHGSLQLEPYWPSATFEVSQVQSSNFADPQPLDINSLSQIATAVLTQNLGIASDQFVVTSSYQDSHNSVFHMYIQQVYEGLPIGNAVANVNLDSYGNLLSIGSTIPKQNNRPLALPGRRKRSSSASSPALSARDALTAFLAKANITSNPQTWTSSTDATGRTSFDQVDDFAQQPVKASLIYYQTPAGLVKAWNINIYTRSGDDWYDAFVDATTGDLIGVSNWVNQFAVASYRVIPFTSEDLSVSAQVWLVDPVSENRMFNASVSPLGWHDEGNGPLLTTMGNNVYAQEDWNNTGSIDGRHRPAVNASLAFDFTYDPNRDPMASINASVTQLFYMNNMAHDIFYMYGFTEAAGNFQTNNFGNSGLGNDAVVAFAQDGAGINNADFATPPDGSPGRMRMYIFTKTTPNRDGAMDNSIIFHEYGHGVSNRLTGGQRIANCLTRTESMGLGEGWSDFFAYIISLRSTLSRFSNLTIGGYTAGNPRNVRNYPSTSNTTANPLTYANMTTTFGNVHSIGEIWTAMLMEAAWNLIETLGFENDIRNSDSGKGNTVMLQLVIDGLKLQPCNPDFVSARNAIIQADKIANQGQNVCLLWAGFAKRGLGAAAVAGTYVNSMDMGDGCLGTGQTPVPTSVAPWTTSVQTRLLVSTTAQLALTTTAPLSATSAPMPITLGPADPTASPKPQGFANVDSSTVSLRHGQAMLGAGLAAAWAVAAMWQGA
ncbi:Fungalysin metallopeptidase-domain-containing protein [Polychytrium aggregatum]|uniref:Fungalysin metallopeptidase-domain-containing protein n=1 Tax=Polychytrium aggregatum TaxID=110093 RepID=UPI0022FDC500|nr:Fungalysin metallopeptidase-domain-containing protein [Polychytrium aggregatum]KAI9203573.1 Fungalysin metallopeptidase-domain-containing protein [Polychytrium aggregatum]